MDGTPWNGGPQEWLPSCPSLLSYNTPRALCLSSPESTIMPTRHLVFALTLLSAGGLASPIRAQPPDPFDQSGVPLEVQPTDPKLAKIVLVAGRQSHGPGEHEFFAG